MTPLIIICGPTAVGKSTIAILLAQKLNAEIVSADSQQVYRGFDIGTGKLPQTAWQGIPHHLIDVVAPTETFDAAKFVQLADAAIADITARGKRVIVVGGTGLYIKALLSGLVQTASRDGEFRKQLEARIADNGIESLHKELQHVDPQKAAVISSRDKTRIIRALEVYHLTGQPMSAVQAGHGFASERYPAQWVGLTLPREELLARIQQRVDAMFASGWIDEVRELMAQYGREIPPFLAVGYREIADYLEKKCTETELREKIYVATRQYSKRQMTWLRSNSKMTWFSPTDVEKIVQHLAKETL